MMRRLALPLASTAILLNSLQSCFLHSTESHTRGLAAFTGPPLPGRRTMPAAFILKQGLDAQFGSKAAGALSFYLGSYMVWSSCALVRAGFRFLLSGCFRSGINQTSYPRFIQEVGALAMESATYEWMLRHVIKPGSASPGAWPYGMPTWVFSSRELPGIPGMDIRFVKGHDAGLLDEIIVQVGSVALGSGKPLPPRAIVSPSLKLVFVQQMGEGFAERRYEVPRRASPAVGLLPFASP